MTNSETKEAANLSKSWMILANLGVLVLFLVIVAGVYFYVVKKGKGQVVFPAGINYLSPRNETTPAAGAATAPLYDFAKLAESVDWVSYDGKTFAYTFQHPKALTPLTFANDTSDSVTFKVSNVPPELNLLLLVETISSRDKNLTGKQEQFVKDYWKFFSGLAGLNSINTVTNEKGMKGYRATYNVKGGGVTSDNYFFVIEGDPDHVIRIANIFGAEGETLFRRIVNSLEYKK